MGSIMRASHRVVIWSPRLTQGQLFLLHDKPLYLNDTYYYWLSLIPHIYPLKYPFTFLYIHAKRFAL